MIGRRRIDTHFLALEPLGARVAIDKQMEFGATHLSGADVFLDEPSVTATENVTKTAVCNTTKISRHAFKLFVLSACMLPNESRTQPRPTVALQTE